MESNNINNDNVKEKKIILTKQEEIELLIKRNNNGENLSNKEKKILNAHEKFMSEKSLMEEEFRSGLSSFSLTVNGRSSSHKKVIDKDKSIIEELEFSDDEDYGPTLSATDIIVPSFTLTAPQRVLFRYIINISI